MTSYFFASNALLFKKVSCSPSGQGRITFRTDDVYNNISPLYALKREYKRERNDFKKRDIVNEAKDTITKHKPTFKNKHIAFWGNIIIGKYDFEKNTFPVQNHIKTG